MKVNDNIIDYIRQHLNDRPRSAVAEHLGISVSTLYRYVRQLGGEIQHSRSTRNKEWEAVVRANYAGMSGREIERRFGITPGRANKIAESLGLSHSPETLKRFYKESLERLDKFRGSNDAQRLRAWKRRRRMDELRVMQGEDQRTKFRLRRLPVKTYKAMYSLCRRYGYIMVKEEPFVLYYDGHTKRRPLDEGAGNENYYIERYKITFMPYDEYYPCQCGTERPATDSAI